MDGTRCGRTLVSGTGGFEKWRVKSGRDIFINVAEAKSVGGLKRPVFRRRNGKYDGYVYIYIYI